jgi:hypothetical protein
MSFDGMLNNQCNIEQVTRAQDADSGQFIVLWTPVLSAVKCRIEVKSGGKNVGRQQIFEKASHLLFMRKPLTITLSTKDHRIVIDTLIYEIILIIERDQGTPTHHLEILVDKTEQYK